MSDFPLFPAQASTVAWQVDALYFFLVALTVVFCVLVFGMVAVFAIKYRRRSDDEQPEQNHGNLALELSWTIIPLFLALFVFLLGADVFFRLQRAPADPLEIYAVGKQWMWKIQHESGKREINTLHVPKGQPVRLTMTSEDVLHDFYIPAFRVKNDVIPGRYTTMWFEATQTGEFHLFCAEFCGTQHSGMIGKVIVMEPADYHDWLMGASAGGESMAEAGQRQFQELGCETCHKTASSGRGPSLVGIFNKQEKLANGQEVTVDVDYLRESILQPRAKIVEGYEPIMPVFEGQISEQSLLQIVSYIKSLSESEE
ncbi:MAG: cytochrome c oxidase subunit II [Gemmatimonadetes bacterium]|jgi:cytochrome c oxidase subunit 2|nr:cytochrome c oxidase subunit II [Gemmatimonadota bacterium]